MKTTIKQVFTEEFRAEAVKLVVDQGLSQSEVARRLVESLDFSQIIAFFRKLLDPPMEKKAETLCHMGTVASESG